MEANDETSWKPMMKPDDVKWGVDCGEHVEEQRGEGAGPVEGAVVVGIM